MYLTSDEYQERKLEKRRKAERLVKMKEEEKRKKEAEKRRMDSFRRLEEAKKLRARLHLLEKEEGGDAVVPVAHHCPDEVVPEEVIELK